MLLHISVSHRWSFLIFATHFAGYHSVVDKISIK